MWRDSSCSTETRHRPVVSDAGQGALERDGLKLEGLDLEKKAIIDTIKIAAYNAEEWLLQRLDDYYDDPGDIRQLLLRIFIRLKGQLRFRNSDVVVDLVPPEIPKYRKVLEGLCAELNGLLTLFPGTSVQS